MKRGNPNDNQRSSDRDRKGTGSVQERGAKEGNSSNRDQQTNVKNANAAGQGAIGREEEKQSGYTGGRSTGMENEDIY